MLQSNQFPYNNYNTIFLSELQDFKFKSFTVHTYGAAVTKNLLNSEQNDEI